MITEYGLPNIIDIKLAKTKWKNTVGRKVRTFSKDNLNSQFKDYSKLNLKLHETRTMFRIRTLMRPAKLNMKNNSKFASEQCDACKRIDSQSHILWFPFFAPHREGKYISNDKDLVEYFQKVFKVREDFEASGSS